MISEAIQRFTQLSLGVVYVARCSRSRVLQVRFFIITDTSYEAMKINTRQLRAFLLAAETRSFTKAAKAMHMTPAGLSAMVRELEDQAGERLFERSPRSVALTEAGTQFLSHARNAILSLEKGFLELAVFNRRQSGGIRIAVSSAMATTLVPSVVCAFTQENPGLSCEIIDTELENFPSLIESGQVDAAYGNNAVWPHGFSAERVFSSRTCLIVHKHAFQHCQVIEKPRDWEMLSGANYLTLPGQNSLQRSQERLLLEAQMPDFQRKELQHLATILAFVHAGLGIAFVPEFMLEAYARFDIRKIPIKLLDSSLDYFCIARGDKAVPTQVRRFSSLLAAAAESSVQV